MGVITNEKLLLLDCLESITDWKEVPNTGKGNCGPISFVQAL